MTDKEREQAINGYNEQAAKEYLKTRTEAWWEYRKICDEAWAKYLKAIK